MILGEKKSVPLLLRRCRESVHFTPGGGVRTIGCGSSTFIEPRVECPSCGAHLYRIGESNALGRCTVCCAIPRVFIGGREGSPMPRAEQRGVRVP